MPVGTFSCVWRGICRSIGPEVVHQKVVVQFASSRHLAEWAIRPAEGIKQVVHVSVGTFSCVWSGDRRSIEAKVVHQKVVVQVASSRHLAEYAISTGRRYQASSTCARGNIFVRMKWRSTVDRGQGGASEGCRTIRLQPPLSRVGDFDRPKVSSTRYMCPWEHFRAYEVEIDGRSWPRWCIRRLSYNSPPAAT